MANYKTAFPTVLENMRTLMNILDLTLDNVEKKKLDDKINEANIRHELFLHFFKIGIQEPINKLLPYDISSEIIAHLKRHFQNYTSNIVRNIDVDGLSREVLVNILNKFYYPITTQFFTEMIPPHYLKADFNLLWDKDRKSVSTVLEWLENDKNWISYLEYLKSEIRAKEELDKFTRWKNGDYLPSYQAILNLGKDNKGNQKLGNSSGKIKFWFFIARALDEIRRTDVKDSFFDSFYLNSDISNKEMLLAIHNAQIGYYQLVIPTMIELFPKLNYQLLSPLKEKTEIDKTKAFELIQSARKQLEKLGEVASYQYHWDKLEARWYLFSGDLEKAVKFYEKAFNKGLFRAGKNLDEIIKEALIATSFLEKSKGISNRNFLAHLKNAAIMFKMELSSIEQETLKMNHKDMIEDWEVDIWARSFERHFPKQGWYPNTNYEILKDRSIAIGSTWVEDDIRIKPDYKNPDRKIKIGNSAKRMPQTVWFAEQNKVEIVKNLLDSGADVNQLSDVNESTLIFALENINLLATPVRNQDRQLFDLICQYPHTKETVNKKTDKKQLYPLMLAVESGRADVVQTVLEMGATANVVNFEGCPPLYKCMKMLGMLLHPERARNIFNTLHEQPWDEKAQQIQLEYMRRHRYGYEGIFYDDLSKMRNRDDEISSMIRKSIPNIMFDIMHEQLSKFSSVEELHKIAQLLIDAGANVNFPVDTGLMKGYTPMMFAIENNDPISFNMMLKAGGDIWQPYIGNDGNYYFCQDIRTHWRSNEIKW